MKLIFCVKIAEPLIPQWFFGIEKERKMQYQRYHNFRSYMVRMTGLEPAHRLAMEPKSIVSANSTTSAIMFLCPERHWVYTTIKNIFLQGVLVKIVQGSLCLGIIVKFCENTYCKMQKNVV